MMQSLGFGKPSFSLSARCFSIDWVALKKIAVEFGEQTELIYNGCFCAVDGIALCVKCLNEGSLILEILTVERASMLLMSKPFVIGKSDSCCVLQVTRVAHMTTDLCFLETQLFDILVEVAEEWQKEGLYIAGNSANALAVFLLTPYNNAVPKLIENAFNFFHSSCRICIECLFGNLVMRWGIFWRQLAFKASKVGGVIQAAMLLHNFIVEEREVSDKETNSNFFENFNYDESNRNRNAHREVPNAIATNNNKPKPKGRQDKRLEDLKKLRSKLCNTLAAKSAAKNYIWPLQNGMHDNKHSHIFMSYTTSHYQ